MGNKLNIDLKGKIVVLNQVSTTGKPVPVHARLAKVTGGFGASPVTAGGKVFFSLLTSGVTGYCYGDAIERLATDEEIAAVNQPRRMIVEGWMPMRIVIEDATNAADAIERAKRVPLTEWLERQRTAPVDMGSDLSRLTAKEYSDEALKWWPMLLD